MTEEGVDREALEALQPIHPPAKTFFGRYLWALDHKVIAKQYLWSGLCFLLLGGLLAMVMRWQWAFPGQPVPLLGPTLLRASGGVVGPALYIQLFTMHGLIMIFFAITPILIGALGNFCIPLLIGARDMAFPVLNALSFWVFALSQLLVLASFFVDLGTAGAGWTTYPPLSTPVGTPGSGQTLVVAAILVTGMATVMGAINFITTVIRFRAPGMSYLRMPLTVWGQFLTAILNVLFVPVLAAAALLLLMDRTLGTQFFIAGATAIQGGGDPILFQHLFWIFGHPEVYILILPAWGITADLLAFFSRKPAHWYKGTVLAMSAVTILSGLVYGHHMFQTGMNPLLGQGFTVLTLLISLPAEVLFLNWLRTLYRGSIRLTVPMLFALGMVFVFGLGGLTGLYLAAAGPDIYLHDTMFVVGHFHFTMAAATFFASLAGIYFWYPKMFGRMLNPTLGRLHFWFTVLGITLVFGGHLLVGYAGQNRRLWNPFAYELFKPLQPLNRWTSYFAFALFTGQFFFLWNFLYSMRRGRRAESNPWAVGTLEWSIPSPPPPHNFDALPLVQRGPHELSNPEVERRLGRDWVGQAEVLAGEAPGRGPAPEGAA